MKRQFSFILPIILIFTISFSGCGGGNSSPSPPPPSPETPAEPVTPAPNFTPVPDLPAPFSAMIRVPGAASFPTSGNPSPDPLGNTTKIVDDSFCTTVTYAYYMAQKEVTYEQWNLVRDWAIPNGYQFVNVGTCGGYYNTTPPASFGTFPPTDYKTHPVTNISRRDAIVWCNALTEYHNVNNGASLDYVYKSGGIPIKNANDAACDTIVSDPNAKGFRLPTNMEWEMAARYKGNDNSNGAIYSGGLYWTPASYASGASADFSHAEANGGFAWYAANSNLSATYIYSTQLGGGKDPNALGLRDMSGNVSEWCFDKINSSWGLRGGSWFGNSAHLQVGYMEPHTSTYIDYFAGFRFVRTE